MTVSKIFILSSSDMVPVLTSFIDIKNIPKHYGGELEWDFFDEPNWDDPEFKRILNFQNGFTRVPPGPTYLRLREDGTTYELVAVGSKDQKHRDEVFATIPKAFPEKKGVKKEEEAAPSVATEATAVESKPEAAAPETTDAAATPAATAVAAAPAAEAAPAPAAEAAPAPAATPAAGSRESQVFNPLPLTNGDAPKADAAAPPTEAISKLAVADDKKDSAVEVSEKVGAAESVAPKETVVSS